jgi:hypothetical protein
MLIPQTHKTIQFGTFDCPGGGRRGRVGRYIHTYNNHVQSYITCDALP